MCDPEVTGDHSNTQFWEEAKLAYKTLSNAEAREEYDAFLASQSAYMPHSAGEQAIDREEIERRKRERGRKRFMDDFDFANQEFFGLFQSRTKREQANTDPHELNFDASDI